MRVFVTGATGFIGSAIVRELIGAGHEVIGLARSDTSAEALTAIGVGVQRGSLEDLASLRSGAEAADGVIHTAFGGVTDFAAASAIEGRAIEAIGETLSGSGRPFVVVSGVSVLAPGATRTEEDAASANSVAGPRAASEKIVLALAAQGVRVTAVRLPPSVHGEGDRHGFVPTLVQIARAKGASAYIGDGSNRWPAVHRLDAAHLFRLALEKGTAGARYHAVAEEGIPFRDIAAAIGRSLNLPVVSVPTEEAANHFGWFAPFAGIDVSASSEWTRKQLGWEPTRQGLIADIDQGTYSVK